MKNLKRIIITIMASVLMMVGFTTSASADSIQCNVSGGLYCGKVYNMYGDRGIRIADDYGRQIYLLQGQYSQGVGMRDVQRYYVPIDCKAKVIHGSSTTTKKGGMWHYIVDSNIYQKVILDCL